MNYVLLRTGILLLILAPLCLSPAIAQPSGGEGGNGAQTDQPEASPFLRIGLYAAGALTPNSAEFVGLPGMVSCQGDTVLFGGTTGAGYAVAASVGMSPIPGKSFLSHVGWNVKLGISSSSASFETEEMIGQSIAPSGELSSVISAYTVDATVSTLLIEPMAYYQVSETTPFTIGIGPTLGLPLSATYEHRESIASPSGATYTDGSTERNQSSGDIEETAGMLLGGTLGLAYDVRLSPIFTLRPELTGTLGFGKVVTDTDWTQHSIRLGFSLLYNTEADLSTPLSPTN